MRSTDPIKFTEDGLGGAIKRVLILGDFTLSQTIKMLRCVEAASHLIHCKPYLMLKPHPVCRIGKESYPTLEFDLTDKPLADIMGSFDFAFSSNSSSAGLDAFLAGLPVAVFLDNEDLNHSPLRGVPNVSFVSSGAELAAVWNHEQKCDSQPAVEDFFCMGKTLPRWRALLSR